jgi:hypothetical protein
LLWSSFIFSNFDAEHFCKILINTQFCTDTFRNLLLSRSTKQI